MIDDSFFMSENMTLKIKDTIDRIEGRIENQSDVDNLWKDIKNLFLEEMEQLPSLGQVKNKSLRKMTW